MFPNYHDQLERDARRASIDEPCCFVATGTAMLIAGLAAAGTSTAVGAYSAHKQGEANDNALAAQTAANRTQFDYLNSQAARDQANFDQTFAENQREWQATQDRNYGIYQQREAQLAPFRASALAANNTLSGLMGRPVSFNAPSGDTPPSLSTMNTSSSSSTSGNPAVAPYLQTLLQTGTAIPDAVKQTNDKFGLTTGNEATYYPNNGTIGLPDSYLMNGDHGWQINPRTANAGASSTSTPFTPGGATLANLMAQRTTTPTSATSANPYAGITTPLIGSTAPMPQPIDMSSLYNLMQRYQGLAAGTPNWVGPTGAMPAYA